MTEQISMTDIQTRLQVLVNQRNTAMDQVAILSGNLAVRDERIEALEQELEQLKQELAEYGDE